MLCTTAVNTSNTITYAVNAFLVFGCRQQGGVESGSTRRRKTGPDRTGPTGRIRLNRTM